MTFFSLLNYALNVVVSATWSIIKAIILLFKVVYFHIVFYIWCSSVVFYPHLILMTILEYWYFGTFVWISWIALSYIAKPFDKDSKVFSVLRVVLYPICAMHREFAGTYSLITDPEGVNFEDKIINNERKSLILSGPHGFLSLGSGVASQKYPSTKVALAHVLAQNPQFDMNFKMGGYYNGCIKIKNTVIEEHLSKGGENLVVIPGGYYDLAFSSAEKYMIHTGKWRYYIKRALKYDYDIVFRWVFGEHHMYKLFPARKWCRYIPFYNKIKLLGARAGFHTTISYGRWGTMYPNDTHFRVTGYHVSTKKYTDELKKLSPTDNQYTELMNKYIEEIYKELIEKSKMRIDYAVKHDKIYGSDESSYAFVENDKDVVREFF